MKTLQEQYNLIKEGKGAKDVFLKEAKRLFPNIIHNSANFVETSHILKSKQIIAEHYIDLKPLNSFEPTPKNEWENKFAQFLKEEAKVIEKKPTEEVVDSEVKGFNYKDEKNRDNIFGQSFINGLYAEKCDPKNASKTEEELKDIVEKNLIKDRLYYTKDSQFGINGIGYTTEHPGLGTPKEPKGKYKSSGYGDLKENTTRLFYGIPDEIKNLEKYGVKITIDPKNTVSPIQRIGIPVNLDDKIYDKIEDILSRYNLKSKKYYINELETRSVDPMVKPEGFQVGDKVKYKGMNHEVTRIIDDRIYIKNLRYGGRPDTWVKAIDLKESLYNILGGERPLTDAEMRSNIVEPNLGPNYTAFIMFKGPKGEYDSIKKQFVQNSDKWKTLYRSRSYQGEASISPDGNVIKASILDNGGIVGAIYVNNSILKEESKSVGSIIKPKGFQVGDKVKYKVAYNGKGFYGITNGGKIEGEYSKEEAQKKADEKNKFINEIKNNLYQISKSGPKSNPHYILEKPDGSKQIDMMFDTYQDAEAYAKKKGFTTQKGLNEVGGEGLLVYGKTKKDNLLIEQVIEELGIKGIFNSNENYWFFPNNDNQPMDSLENQLEKIFIKKGIQAKFKGRFNESLNRVKHFNASSEIKEIEKTNEILALEAKIKSIDEAIEKRQAKLKIAESEELAEMVDKSMIKKFQKEIKELEKYKAKASKMYEKMTGSAKKEVIDEKENSLKEESDYSKYSNDALNDMIVSLSRFEGNEDLIQMAKAELEKRSRKNNISQSNEVTEGKSILEELYNDLIKEYSGVSQLNVVFKSTEDYIRAKEWFNEESDFYPEGEYDEFRTISFEVADQEDADALEKALDQELTGADIYSYHFESM
jgi:hypothetical protein